MKKKKKKEEKKEKKKERKKEKEKITNESKLNELLKNRK